MQERQRAQRDAESYLERVAHALFHPFNFTTTSDNPHNSDFLSTATALAGMPRLIYIAPAHDETLANRLNELKDNTGVDVIATGIVNNPIKTTISNPELIMSEQNTYDLPDAYLLRELDDAHEKGFRDFLGHHRYDARCQVHRKQAANALSNLIDGLKKALIPNMTTDMSLLHI